MATNEEACYKLLNVTDMLQAEKPITFDQLPEVVSSLVDEVRGLKDLILNGQYSKEPVKDEWFDVDGLCAYHPDKPAKKTVYDWVTLRRVPYHKDGKRLRFLKSEIDAWLAGGYHKTEDEMQEAAVDYVNAKRMGAL